ncbi:LysR family transcriptional regulator [Photobacterium sp. S4TG1]|uniref:LysR family transcriptional regulator n=1 Tax=Photobacterium sp. S4TG1 TaxID=3114587 RepID=UPI002E1806E6|nr:LysR family transcriptional regulator [Photobacterium sp. S4TG1]
MDKFISMEIFVRSVDLGSFVAVSEEFGISAPMVGKHIRGLEKYLGVKLLIKTTRFQSLTYEGESFYQHCLIILNQLKKAQEDIYLQSNEPCGKLKIHSSVNFGINKLSSLLANFCLKYPKLEIDLTLSNENPDRKIDNYDIIFHDREDDYDFMISNKICSFEMLVCASPFYLNKNEIPQNPYDLEKHNCLIPNSLYKLYRWHFIKEKKKLTPRLNSQLMINSDQAMLMAALEGIGVTIQPRYQVESYIKEKTLIEILCDYSLPKIDLYMLYKPSLRTTIRLNLLKDFIIKNINTA